MADYEVQIEKLVLIEGDLLAQRMIVTWEKAYLEYGELLDEAPHELGSDSPFTAAWARIAGVDVDDVWARAPVLFENGLLLENGTVSDTAMGYVKSRLIAEMPRVQP